jgi:hypothetical protein
MPAENLGGADSMLDLFLDDHPAGQAIGSATQTGIVRKGIDREGVIGMDHGALRIGPLVKPGWGRSGIAYGPYSRRNGLAFGTFLLNGHNTSQAEPLLDEFSSRLHRWILGSETEKPLTRLSRLARGRQRKYIRRRLWQWIRSGTRFFRVTLLNENLAVGWFPSEVPANPLQEGNSFVMHALGPECGELWARVGAAHQSGVRGVQNIPIYYMVVLRQQGAAYYAASMPHVPGFSAAPTMRMIGVDGVSVDPVVYAGIHQSVLGQIGFRVDTRVYSAQVATLPEFSNWFGSAHGADRLTGDGTLHLSEAEVGGEWLVHEGSFMRTEAGLVAIDLTNRATLQLVSPAGFLHVSVKTTDQPVDGVALIWRAKDEFNFWCFDVGTRQCRLSFVQSGERHHFPSTRAHFLTPNALNSLQICDDGENIALHLNGELVYATRFSDGRLQNATGAGIQLNGSGQNVVIHSFEAHPRNIPIPNAFELRRPCLMEGNHIVAKDDFAGPIADLAGRTTIIGERQWRRQMGRGVLQLTGSAAAKVLATVERPCPGRTAYTIDWMTPDFADVAVRITPPGQRRGLNEKGRGGLIFWQDDRNYITLTVFMDDWYGTSIAAFFYVDGYEELYDAVWTNVGRRIYWGTPYHFRVVFDGKRFLASVNGEPVLYRALTDVYPDWESLQINRTGVVANWEWGNDTGSVFEHFIARDRI